MFQLWDYCGGMKEKNTNYTELHNKSQICLLKLGISTPMEIKLRTGIAHRQSIAELKRAVISFALL
jgi:hypothetical protein